MNPRSTLPPSLPFLHRLTGLALLAGLLLGLPGCATKGARKVNAYPISHPSNAAIAAKTTPDDPAVIFTSKPIRPATLNSAPAQSPRVIPGQLLDPAAKTFAQVPTRIFYFPGSSSVFSRQSATQEVAYQLVPTSRIPEIRSQAPPNFELKPHISSGQTAPVTFTTTFMSPDYTKTTGSARTLGITSELPDEERRARSMLETGEELRLHPKWGWVAFTPIQVTPPRITAEPAANKNDSASTGPKPHGKEPELKPINGAVSKSSDSTSAQPNPAAAPAPTQTAVPPGTPPATTAPVKIQAKKGGLDND